MKTSTRLNQFFSPLKVCALLALTAFSVNVQAEYYYVEDAPIERSPKCVSVKRYKCVKHCYVNCYKKVRKVKRVIRHHYYRPVYRPAVRYYEYYGPVTVPTCGSGCYSYSACPSCNDYYVSYTRYAYVCDGCGQGNWVPGYSSCCDGRWVAGHWRY